MPDSLLPPGWGFAPFDERDLDAVLAGKTGDVPVALRPVADVLAALRAGAVPAELYGEANAMAEFRALRLGQAGRPAGQARTMPLEALPDSQRVGRPGRQPARHRVRPGRRQSARRAVLRPAVLSAFAAAAVIVLAVLVTGNFVTPFRDIAHMASPSAGTRSATGTTGRSTAPRVETSSAGLDTTPPPPAAHSTAPAQSVVRSTCRAYYSYYRHPEGLSAWATQQSLWEQLTKLAGSDSWVEVYQFCAPYVQDLFPYAPAADDNQGPPRQGPGNRDNGYLGQQQPGAPANSRDGLGGGRVGDGQAGNGQAAYGQGDGPGGRSNP